MSYSQMAVFHLHSPNADTAPMPVWVGLAWDPADPVAVKATFHTGRTSAADVEWVFSRSLLADGMSEPAGIGDVRVLPPVDGELRIIFDNPSGHADFTVDVDTIQGFLEETFRRCPEGREFARIRYQRRTAGPVQGGSGVTGDPVREIEHRMAMARPWDRAEASSIWEITGAYPAPIKHTFARCLAMVLEPEVHESSEPLFVFIGSLSLINKPVFAAWITAAKPLLLVHRGNPSEPYHEHDRGWVS